MKKLLIGLTTLVASLTMLMPATAHASLFGASTNEACKGAAADENATGCDSNAANQVNKVLSTSMEIFSVIVGIITVIMFILAGFRFITSQGDPGNINKARSSLIYAIVGLVIVVIAQALIRFVFAQATKPPPPPPSCGSQDSNGHCTNCPDTNPADGNCDNARLRTHPSVADLYKIVGSQTKLTGGWYH